MKVLRVLVVVALLGIAAYVGYRALAPSTRMSTARSIAIYYVTPEGEALAKWFVSINPKTSDRSSVALYATAQVLAGPPADRAAIRFPAGTVARSVRVSGTTATVDLGGLARPQEGSLTESGEFKALVWTLTGLRGVSAVQVLVDGARVPTLPGGHLELDSPLTRKSF
ncbi:MAG: hypothetical protein NVS3B17_23330 [Vulcanimicrobiaceae bacterium]